MSYSSIRTSIESIFMTEFALSESGIYIAIDNDGYKPENDDWVRLIVSFGTQMPAALGSSMTRQRGFVFVQVFTGIGKGTAADDRISGSITDIFRARVSNGVRFGNIKKSPPRGIAGWSQSNIAVDFWIDEIN